MWQGMSLHEPQLRYEEVSCGSKKMLCPATNSATGLLLFVTATDKLNTATHLKPLIVQY